MWDYRLGVRQRKRKKPTRRNIAKCSTTSAYSLTDLPTGGRVVLHLVIRPLLYLNVRPEPGKCNDFTSHSRNAIHAGLSQLLGQEKEPAGPAQTRKTTHWPSQGEG